MNPVLEKFGKEMKAEAKVESVDKIVNAFSVTREKACEVLGITIDEYNAVKESISEQN